MIRRPSFFQGFGENTCSLQPALKNIVRTGPSK